MKIGLFFGSFNPIHMGHLIIAQVIKESTDLDKIWFIVSPQNPLKNSKNLLSEYDRLDMVREAIFEDVDFHVSDIEFSLPKPNFTIDTLTYLTEKYPNYQPHLIIGEDNLKIFPKWKNSQFLLDHYPLLVYPRPIAYTATLQHKNITKIDAPKMDISSSLIRRLVRENKSIKYLVPEKVRNLIESRKYFL